MTAGDLEHEVLEYVAEVTKVPRQHLCLSSTLQDDIGLDGDDAVEFLVGFAERFNVDFGQMQFDLHFGPEAGSLLSLIRLVGALLFGRDFAKTELIPITIGQLVDSARTGRWPSREPGGPESMDAPTGPTCDPDRTKDSAV